MKKNERGDLGEKFVEDRGSWHGLDRYLKQATMSMSMSINGGEDKKDDCLVHFFSFFFFFNKKNGPPM